ncbi:MAG: acetyltransferase [Pseudomonadota bacterium]
MESASNLMAKSRANDGSCASSSFVIYGAGGSAKEVYWLATENIQNPALRFCGFVDDNARPNQSLLGFNVSTLEETLKQNPDFYVIAVGDSKVRESLSYRCDQFGIEPITLIHRKCDLPETVKIGKGSIVCAGSILTTHITVGRHSHINVGCTISHDCEIGDYVTISPGVTICGNVHIKHGAFIGAGATLINGSSASPLVVGRRSLVAAGACVTRSVPPNTSVAGVPARSMRTVEE